MRIAHVVQSFDPALGGIVTAPLQMAGRQAEFGASVRIWTESDPSINSLADTVAPLVDSRPGPRGAFDGAFLNRFEREIDGVDVVHLHDFWRPYTARFVSAARRRGKVAVISLHGMLMSWPMTRKRLKKNVWLALAGRRTLQRASAIHLLNRTEREQSCAVGIDFACFDVPNGVDVNEFGTMPGSEAIRVRDPSLANRTIVASLGRLHVIKGPDLLLRAFLDVAHDFPKAVLVLAGPDEGMLPTLRSMIDGHAAATQVRIPGLVRGAERLELLGGCDVFVQPSRSEAMSVSILEAAYAKRCLLITDACSVPEVADCDAGMCVPATAESLRDALRVLLGDSALRERLGANARRMVEERFTLARTTPAMLERYDQLVRGERMPRLLDAAASPAP